ncbi:MAG: serine--tRNA ligase, partial [Ferruginibacter sp.]
MLQINYIRQNADLVKERLAIRNFAEPAIVDEIISLDENIRKQKASTENLQALINSASKEIG